MCVVVLDFGLWDNGLGFRGLKVEITGSGFGCLGFRALGHGTWIWVLG